MGVVVAAVEMKAIREFMDARKRVSVFVHLFATWACLEKMDTESGGFDV